MRDARKMLEQLDALIHSPQSLYLWAQQGRVHAVLSMHEAHGTGADVEEAIADVIRKASEKPQIRPRDPEAESHGEPE